MYRPWYFLLLTRDLNFDNLPYIILRPGEVASIADKEDEDGEKWIHVDYVNRADSQKAFDLIHGWEYNGEDSVQGLHKEVSNDFVDPDEPTLAQRKMMSPFGGI